MRRVLLTGLDGVDGELVVGVHVGKSTRNCNEQETTEGSTDLAGLGRWRWLSYVPNHFLDSLEVPSMTSSTPGARGSIEATWLARLHKRTSRWCVSSRAGWVRTGPRR